MRRRTYRWTDLSKSTRRRIDGIVSEMHARDRAERRRVNRGWIPVKGGES